METVAANVTNGSANISAVTAGTFLRRTGRDVVTGSGLPDGTTVLSPNYDSMTLSEPGLAPRAPLT